MAPTGRGPVPPHAGGMAPAGRNRGRLDHLTPRWLNWCGYTIWHMTNGDLTERERKVLEAVIESYVQTAEPAGSRTIARRFPLGVSAATIRNTMSDLEERGYLFHPHTSAGRVPTDLAYRMY